MISVDVNEKEILFVAALIKTIIIPLLKILLPEKMQGRFTLGAVVVIALTFCILQSVLIQQEVWLTGMYEGIYAAGSALLFDGIHNASGLLGGHKEKV